MNTLLIDKQAKIVSREEGFVVVEMDKLELALLTCAVKISLLLLFIGTPLLGIGLILYNVV